jgi:hypothetical protein
MKKVLFYVLAVLVLTTNVVPVFASFVKEKQTAVSVMDTKPVTHINSLTVEQVLGLTPESYTELTGKKMSFKDRVGLNLAQHSIKKEYKKKGAVDLKDYFADDDSVKFNIGGFALGFFLGLIGVALAHIFSSSKSFRRSSWYGLGAAIIVVLIVVLAGGGKK